MTRTDLERKAREIEQAAVGHAFMCRTDNADGCSCGMTSEVLRLVREAYEAGLEEAAQVVDNARGEGPVDLRSIRDRIRALKSQAGSGGKEGGGDDGNA